MFCVCGAFGETLEYVVCIGDCRNEHRVIYVRTWGGAPHVVSPVADQHIASVTESDGTQVHIVIESQAAATVINSRVLIIIVIVYL